MKKLVLSISAAFLATGLFAQQTEMKAAKSAYDSGKFSEVIAQTQKAEGLLNNDRTIEPESITQMYFNAARAAEKTGDLTLAAEYYARTSEIENGGYYKAKNKDTKNWEYFLTKADADRITASGNYNDPKGEEIATLLMPTVSEEINAKANTSLKLGNESFKAQKYDVAGKEFLKSYYLFKSIGNNNDLLKYYGALSTLQTDNKAEAAVLLQELVDSGFTGVRTNYYAKDAKTGEEVSFANKADMDTQVKLNLVKEPKSETTESLEEELYSNVTYAFYSTEDYDNALKYGQIGLEKYPKNENMNQIVSGVYFKTGNSAEFVKKLEDKIAAGNGKAVDHFNLAKSIEDANGDAEVAKSHYRKAIELDPNFTEAHLNLAFALIKPEKEYVELMNANLGTSSKEKQIYNDNKAKRKKLYQEALPHLEKAYQLDPNSLNIIKVLRNTYEVVDQDEKFFEFKKLYEQRAAQGQ